MSFEHRHNVVATPGLGLRSEWSWGAAWRVVDVAELAKLADEWCVGEMHCFRLPCLTWSAPRWPR